MSKSDPKMNEAVGPFQILAAVAGHLATLREHVERMAKPTFDPEEAKAWAELTEYLDRLRLKRIRPRAKPHVCRCVQLGYREPECLTHGLSAL